MPLAMYNGTHALVWIQWTHTYTYTLKYSTYTSTHTWQPFCRRYNLFISGTHTLPLVDVVSGHLILLLGNPSLISDESTGHTSLNVLASTHHSWPMLIQPIVALLCSPGINESRSSAWQAIRLTVQPQLQPSFLMIDVDFSLLSCFVLLQSVRTCVIVSFVHDLDYAMEDECHFCLVLGRYGIIWQRNINDISFCGVNTDLLLLWLFWEQFQPKYGQNLVSYQACIEFAVGMHKDRLCVSVVTNPIVSKDTQDVWGLSLVSYGTCQCTWSVPVCWWIHSKILFKAEC